MHLNIYASRKNFCHTSTPRCPRFNGPELAENFLSGLKAERSWPISL